MTKDLLPDRAAESRRRIASFDVFDTALTRIYAVPEDVYAHLDEMLRHRKLYTSQESFANLRQWAEARAWKDGGMRAGATLSAIYTHLREKLNWTPAEAEEAMHLEAELELAAVRPVPEVARRIEAARNEGRPIWFVSDMHLGSPQIQAMLAKTGEWQQPDRLFVSSECGKLKSTGELFHHALQQTGTHAGRVHHTGDQWRGDLRGARRAGIAASLYTRAHLNRLERRTLDALRGQSWQARSLVAVSKFARLSRDGSDPSSATWDMIASAAAPFIAGFGLWLIEEARKRGIKKLFFLARDMQIAHQVTKYLAAKMGADLRCEYIYASRAAWLLTGYQEGNRHDLWWLFDKLATDRPQEVLKRLFPLRPGEEIDKLLASSRAANPGVANDLKTLLSREPLRSAVQQSTSEARRILLDYLEQSGYEPTPACAFVDAGWRGTLQRSLAKAYSAEGAEHEIACLYVGLRHHLGEFQPHCPVTRFLAQDDVERLGYSLITLIESFFIASHGTTLALVRRGERIEPELSPGRSGEAQAQWLLVRDACMRYAEELTASPAWSAVNDKAIAAMQIPLLELCENPTKEEALPFSTWRYDEGRGDTRLKPLAARMVPKDIAKLLVARARSQGVGDLYLASTWVPGSIAVSPLPWRIVARLLGRSSGSSRQE